MVKRRRMMQIMAKRSATNPRKRLPELTRPCSALNSSLSRGNEIVFRLEKRPTIDQAQPEEACIFAIFAAISPLAVADHIVAGL